MQHNGMSKVIIIIIIIIICKNVQFWPNRNFGNNGLGIEASNLV
jgi:hypothetical protein